MATFDQRGQKVINQYNAGSNINFASVHDRREVAVEIQKLLAEVSRTIQIGEIEEKVATAVEANVKKAVIEAQNAEPDKKTVLNYLEEAKALLDGITSATGLVAGLIQAVELVRRLF